ncbi:hypothetical protein ACIP93_33480 [Streptomyces sp. NPDC088745]|uniref:hypothetical protein n=1 Tax=Streptomyces sp. NPDC088745 TaxID=3365884 RepID=UPI0038167113
MSDSFAKTSGLLIEQIRTARARGDEDTARSALGELLARYVQLGRRELGTIEEQNGYIVPRHLGYLPQVLQELGVTPDDLPEPPGRRRPAPPPPAAGPTAADAARIAEHFAHLGGPDSQEPQERFDVAYRPQDNVVICGRLQPFAVVDTEEHHLPVSWYDSRDAAETIAGVANRMRRPA